jgi:transglycosylase-like protein with SLT domain
MRTCMLMSQSTWISKIGKTFLTTTLLSSVLLCGSVSTPAEAGPPLSVQSVNVHRPAYGDIETNWGYGPAENSYNHLIEQAIEEHWTDKDNPLDPLMFKALIAVESAFKTNAYSRTGCAGLVQISPDTARRFGLSMSPIDERLIPEKAIPVGVKVLAEKQLVVLQPDNYYGILLGTPDKKLSYGTTVHKHYQSAGMPQGNDLLNLGFASYNGGGGTIMRAMAKAVEMGKNPLDWNALVGSGPSDSPLYAACLLVYKGGAHGKYQEMANYPKKIFKLMNKR